MKLNISKRMDHIAVARQLLAVKVEGLQALSAALDEKFVQEKIRSAFSLVHYCPV